jgi:hypothetical protein
MNNETPQITINDFVLAVSVIDACSERGSFKGNELITVGQLREKFVAFVKANTNETAGETEPQNNVVLEDDGA